MIRYLRLAKKKDLAGVALLRLDFNTKDGDWRMAAVMSTVRLLANTARAVLIVSHRGRPATSYELGATSYEKEKRGFTIRETQIPDQSFSLRKNAEDLSRMLGKKVTFIPDFDFTKIKAQIVASPRGSVYLLENIRFVEGEEKNDPRLAKALASLAHGASSGQAGFYVNDAFAVDHRAQASVVAVTKFLPSYAGLELEKEIKHLSAVMKGAKHPFVLILGGAKAGDKLGVLKYFQNKADSILLGGGSANTILALRGLDVKKSLRDTDEKDLKALRPLAARHNVIAPVDYVWSGGRILDIGYASIKDFSKIIAGAKTILWSGPLGMTDDKKYETGTLAIARAIAANRKAFSVVGGGETVAFVKKHKLDKKFSFVSTGGGAMLDFLAGKKLPGIEALKNKRIADSD